MKTSFILHIDSLSILKKMPDDMAGKFIKIIYDYHINGEVPEMEFALEMAITPFINQFERDFEKYENTCNRNKINGLNGGRPNNPKKPKETQKTHSVNLKPKKADNDSDSDNDSKNESKKEKDNNNDNNSVFIFSQKSFKNWTLEDFQDSIKNENKTTLERTELLAFYDYWRELSPGGKFRFQLNQTWNTELRLNTWQRNKKEKGFKTVQEMQKNKMGDAFYEAAVNLKNKLNTTKNGSSTI